MQFWSLGWEDPTHFSIAWRIPCTEEPGGLQSIGLQNWLPQEPPRATGHLPPRICPCRVTTPPGLRLGSSHASPGLGFCIRASPSLTCLPLGPVSLSLSISSASTTCMPGPGCCEVPETFSAVRALTLPPQRRRVTGQRGDRASPWLEESQPPLPLSVATPSTPFRWTPQGRLVPQHSCHSGCLAQANLSPSFQVPSALSSLHTQFLLPLLRDDF